MRDDCLMTVVVCPYEEAGCTFHVGLLEQKCIVPTARSHRTKHVTRYKIGWRLSDIIIQHIIALPKYGHGALDIRRPYATDVVRYT